MERPDLEMLELLSSPALAVENGTVTYTNQLAAGLAVVGSAIADYLGSDLDEYRQLESGTLYLTFTTEGCPFGASVTRMAGYDIFVLDPQQSQNELHTIALAARELRKSLTSVFIAADNLPATPQAGQLNRGLHQMLRLAGNLSGISQQNQGRQELRDIAAVIREIFEKAAVLAEAANIRILFDCFPEEAVGLVDSERLERAIYNILSNAIKFTPTGGTVTGSLTRHGNRLRLSVRDCGSGVPDDVLGSVFTRHQRPLTLEDSRYGMGLGMVLVREAAIAHGGTVLIQRIPEGGTCVTMTLTLRKSNCSTLRCPIIVPDYAGGFDHGMIELADVLPPKVYESK